MAAPPELAEILAQVESEVAAMRAAGKSGTVTVHVGLDQIVVKAVIEHKYEPVRFERARMNVIRRPR